MKVYILLEEDYYDYGDELSTNYNIWVFSSRKKAEEHIDKMLSGLSDEVAERFRDDFKIIEYEIDSGVSAINDDDDWF